MKLRFKTGKRIHGDNSILIKIIKRVISKYFYVIKISYSVSHHSSLFKAHGKNIFCYSYYIIRNIGVTFTVWKKDVQKLGNMLIIIFEACMKYTFQYTFRIWHVSMHHLIPLSHMSCCAKLVSCCVSPIGYT